MWQSYTRPMFEHDPSLPFSVFFAASLLLGLMLKVWLQGRQVRHVAAHRNTVPAPFASRIDLAAHQKAADYTIAKARMAVITTAFEAAVLLGWTLLGGLDQLNGLLRGFILDGSPDSAAAAMAYQLSLILSVSLIGAILDMPFEWYRTFVIEQRYGFNRSTVATFLSDGLKSLIVTLILMVPLSALVLWIMQSTGGLWWLWAFAVITVFQLTMAVVYPSWIAPLFNRFTPLQQPELEARIRQLMQRCGFSPKDLLVMDASRRSSHGNAYFTGLGRSKRVVFFDTLLKTLTPAEVEAVLAHELGHFKHRHTTQRLLMMTLASLAFLSLLGWLCSQAWFYTGLGVRPNLNAPNDALALILFMLAMPVFSTLLTPLAASWSRSHEFQADAYAASQSDRAELASALLKLHEDNASTLTPDPVYVGFFYSHPPALQRIQALMTAPPQGTTA